MKTNTLDLDTQVLRQRILDLAMRGKLVEQDPSDAPASVTLEKIKTEKAELVKEKKIKKSGPLPKISDGEKSFDIPDSWEWTHLGEISRFVTKGTTPRGGEDAYSFDGVKFFRAENIKKGKLLLNPIKYVSKEINEGALKRSILAADDVLVTIAGSLGRVAVVKKENLPGNCNQAIAICRMVDTDEINVDFLAYALSNETRRILKKKKTTSIPNLTLQNISNTAIPLPPLLEQKRIAAKIDQLFALIQKIETAAQQYDELKTALKSKVLNLAMRGKLVKQKPNDEPAIELLEQIEAERAQLIKEKKISKSEPLPEITDNEKPFDIPDSWKWVRLGDIGVWAAGATPSRNHPEYYGGNIPWLKTGDLTDGVVDTTSEKITELGVKNSSVKLNKPGNVLIAMYGATIGKLGIVGGREIVTNQACCGCSLFEGISNWYLFYYLLASRKRLIELGSGGAQPNISKNKIENFVFPLPPLEEQKRIVNKIEKVFSSL